MADFVVPLSDPLAQDPAVTGGKGAALAKLIRAKLPVPDGFVVTTAAFERGAGDLLPAIEKSIDDLPPDDQAPLLARGTAIERASKEAIELLKSHEIPAEIADAIIAAYDGLGGGSVAVRSSATAEDMPDASFAGQYDTYLNVLTPKSVVQRVLDVWASLYSVHAIAYRKRQGISESALRMAVVVQRLLPAQSAGVLFTRDPVSGADDRFVINVAYGLGEGVVEGSVPVDTFTLQPRSGKIVSKEIADKRHKMDLAARGGLKRTTVSRSRRRRAALSARQAADLTKLAKRVKKLFGGHQDIEFAVHNGSVHLLQARPVTGMDEAPEFAVEWRRKSDEKHGWLLLTGRRKAKPSKRLARDIHLAQANAARVCFLDTGSAMTRMHYVSFFNGYAYGHGPNVSEETVRKRRLRHRQRIEWYTQRQRSYWEEVLQPQVERELAKLADVPARRASLAEHIGYLEQAIDSFSYVFGDLHWRLVGDANPMDWTKTIAELTGMDEPDVGVFVQAADNIETRMIRAMRLLARQVQRSTTLRKLFAERAFDRLQSAELRNKPAVRRFRSRFRRFLTRYGLRTGYGFGSSSSVHETPTWNMDHQRPLRIIAAYVDQDLSAMARVEARSRKERDRMTRNMRRRLAGSKARLRRFEVALAQGRNFVAMMEDHNNMMEQNTGGRLREAIHRTGLAFVDRGLLDRPEQLLHLSLTELKALAHGRSRKKLRELIHEREREYREQSRLQPPPKLGSGDLPPPPDMAKTWEAPADAGRSGNTIKGVSGSRGRATGRARVFAETDQIPDVIEGDILVAANAGPDWTPIFPLLAGLVLDQGAVFQHAALIAREYKIPAVIMTKEASTTIKDGQTITVDGDAGVVELE
ncbi:MAG: hypothetical protein IIC91_03615 [Chloroflexi bacterium]|nr:hypothetical protein [Chloroflexota bacterium]